MARKIFLPICSNGGGVDPRYATGLVASFFGRDIDITVANVSDPHPANVLSRATHIFRRTDCEEMFIVDADIEPTRAAVDQLLSHDLTQLGAVFGWYHKKMFPPEACVVGLGEEGGTITKGSGLHEFRAAGRGFCRIHRSVFNALVEREELRSFTNFGPEPILEIWQSGVNERGEFEHEDFNFCRRIRALGYKVLVDTSAHVLHWGHFPYGTVPEMGQPACDPQPQLLAA